MKEWLGPFLALFLLHFYCYIGLAIAGPVQSLEVDADRSALRVGEAVQLRVTARYGDGSSRDITQDPQTQYLSTVVDGCIDVGQEGRVTVLSLPKGLGSFEVGILVTHGIATGSILFDIVEGQEKFQKADVL